MNRTIVAALALFVTIWIYPEWSHAGPELKVTAYEAGLDSASAAPGEGTVVAPRAKMAARWSKTTGVTEDVKPAPKPAPKFVIRAIITVEGSPVWVGGYRGAGPWDDKAECEAYMGSDEYKESRDGLEAVAKLRFHPDAKVGVSCEEIPAE